MLPAGLPFLSHERGCLSGEIKPEKSTVLSLLHIFHWQPWLHATITAPSKVWGSRRGRSRKPQDAASTPPIRQVVKPSSLGGGRVIQDMPLEPSASDFSRNTLWKPPEPQMGSLGLALVGWVTLAPFFLQRFPAQERVHHLPTWITPSLLPETLMGSGNQRAMSPAAQLQMQHPKPAKNA